MNRTKSKPGILAVFAACLMGCAAASAQEKFPSRPVQIVVPTPPGGGTDVDFRLLAELAEPALGQKVIIINRGGGAGMVGVSSVVREKPDGYTLAGIWNSPLTMTPQIESAPYKPNDYEAVLLINAAPTVLCTKSDFPAATGQDLIATIKANPGRYTYGTDGVGGFMQLAVERILSQVGAKARSVPFASAGETLLAMLGGHIDIYSGAVTIVEPYVKNGQAKCLLLTSAKRIPSLPGAASLTDVGLADAETLVWHGLIGPNGIPVDRLTTLQAAFDKAAHSERYVKYAESRGIDIDVRTSADFRKLIDSEYSAMSGVINSVGLLKK